VEIFYHVLQLRSLNFTDGPGNQPVPTRYCLIVEKIWRNDVDIVKYLILFEIEMKLYYLVS
jgi:hypothetical protein